MPLVIISAQGGLGQVWQQIGKINPDLLNAGKLVNFDLAKKVMWTSSPQVIVIIWKNLLAYTGLYEIIPGFILSALVIFFISYFSQGPSPEVEKEFEKAMKPLVNE